MINTIENLNFQKLKELVIFSKENSNIDLNKFFPNLSALQLLEFNFICSEILKEKSNAEELFNNFKDKNKEVIFDQEGKSEPIEKKYWEITLHSLDSILENAEKTTIEDDNSPSKINTQVILAKKPSLLKDYTNIQNSYRLRRQLFLKNNSNQVINSKILNKYEEIYSKYFNTKVLFSRIISFIEGKNILEYQFFIKHIFSRLDCLYQDNLIEHPSNKEFLDELKLVEA